MHDFTYANARYLEVPTPATTQGGPIRSFEGALHMKDPLCFPASLSDTSHDVKERSRDRVRKRVSDALYDRVCCTYRAHDPEKWGTHRGALSATTCSNSTW